jgi:hypothetical protein
MNLNESIIRIHEMMGIDKPEMVYDYEEGRNTVPDRLPFDVDKLVNAGVVFVTPAIDGDRESKTYKKWLDEPYSHLITLHNIDHSNKDSWIDKAITKKAPTNVWEENFGEKLYDGKYNQILWSLNKLGINPEDMLVDDSSYKDEETNLNEDISRVKELMLTIILEQPDSKFGLERFGYNPEKPETMDKAIESQRELHNSQIYRTSLQVVTSFVPVIGPAISMGLLGLDVKRDYDKASTEIDKKNIILSYIVGMAFVWGMGRVFKSVANLGEDGMTTLSKKLKMRDAYKFFSKQEAAVIFEVTKGKKFWEDKVKFLTK